MPAPNETAREAAGEPADSGWRFFESMLAAWSAQSGIDTAVVLSALTDAIRRDPARWEKLQQDYYTGQLELWRQLAAGGSGDAPPSAADRRFSAPEWYTLPYFDFLRRSYLHHAHWLQQLTAVIPLDGRAKKRLDFFMRQYVDAMAPANFAATNPEVIRLSIETGGDSLRRGMMLLREDAEKKRITMCDESAFEIGRNIAVTPGDVVYENELMQLIQYRPLTANVHARPLVMIPPCINKYYILDLQPANSFVRFAVERGFTVFMVSWRNVPAALGTATWDQYLESGVIRPMAVAREICACDRVNTLGFCVGGTLLASALAVLRARGERPAASVTLLTTMLDFSDTGDLSVFIDEDYVRQRERADALAGLMHGRELAMTFASLRANDLIWNYVVNGYLKGRKPAAFDLLYWNSDSTNLPGTMFAYYVRNTYLENNLCVPGRLTMCGARVDLSRIDAPSYLMASREDHIVPWRTAWQNTRLLSGERTFVLAASGHIAGVINPAAANKRHYWTGTPASGDADAWLAAAARHPGSWWPHWSGWLAGFAGRQVAAAAGNATYPALEPAPGRYVRERCD